MLLHLPDIRQTRDWNCGEAAVRCVLAFHQFAACVMAGVRISSPVDGVDPLAAERYLSNLGLRTLAGSMTTADLKHFADHARPTICLVHWRDAPESHYVVCRGVGRGRVYFHDVDAGPGQCPLAEWELAWTARDGRRGHVYPRWGIVAWPG